MRDVTQITQVSFGTAESCCERFVSESLRLCWLMAIQDPPVRIMDWKGLHGQPFNKNVFKHYTNTGTIVDYVVWPPLLLHEEGSLLGKGVAQGMDSDEDFVQSEDTKAVKLQTNVENVEDHNPADVPNRESAVGTMAEGDNVGTK